MMTRAEKVDYWVDIARYDLQTAAAMFKSRRYLYTVFMCEQALEKLLKGLYIFKEAQEVFELSKKAFRWLRLQLK